MLRETGQDSSFLTPQSSNSFSKDVFVGRVKYCMLDNKTYPNVFKNFGEWSSIGGIFFQRVNASNPDKDFTTDNFALPLFPNNKVFPLENEIVYLIALPNNDVQSNVSSLSYYYFQPINLWNSNHHNAIPDPINDSSIPTSQQRDYQQTSIGAVRKVTDGGTEIKLGNTFKEKINIKNIQPYEGDVVYEGRWGQSLRLGSTVNNSAIPNPWSRVGNNGDPLLILRTGQYADGKDPWIPQVEDINKDISAIYATSTQKIPIQVSSKRDYNSYQKAPESPEQFAGEQIILNSGRLLFNTKTDSILFSSKKTINLNSVESVNIDSPTFVVSSTNIFLGDKNATEPIILGDTFLNDLQQLLTQLIELSKALQTPIGTPGGSTNISIAGPAQIMITNAQNMLNRINNYKSKVSKTK
jgi:hypothetical protein